MKYIVFYDDVDILETKFVSNHDEEIVFENFKDAKKSLVDYQLNNLAHARADLQKSRSLKRKNR